MCERERNSLYLVILVYPFHVSRAYGQEMSYFHFCHRLGSVWHFIITSVLLFIYLRARERDKDITRERDVKDSERMRAEFIFTLRLLSEMV